MALLHAALIVSFLSSINTVTANPKNPVIFVPGDGGSQLFAKLDRPSVKHAYCSKSTGGTYFNIWLSLDQLIPLEIDCFVDNMQLHYDPINHTTHNTEGVEIIVQDFGDPKTVEWLDADTHLHYSPLSYFVNIAEALVAHNFTRGKNLMGAPYDFRKAPNELGQFYYNLTTLIESTFVRNNNTKVVIVGHSMGNPVMLYYFNQKPQVWKDKYIQSFVSLAGVWGGAVKPVRLICSGDALGVVIVNPYKVRAEQRSMPSTVFLMPSPKFWKNDEVLVVTDRRNYTVADYEQLFQDLNFTDGWYMRQDTENLIMDLIAPGVETHCLHGLGLETPEMFKFGPGGFPDVYPATIYGNGDGTVNRRSLEACTNWVTQQKQTVKHVVIDKAEHMQILKNKEVIDYIITLVTTDS